jgi:hypothetical protein
VIRQQFCIRVPEVKMKVALALVVLFCAVALSRTDEDAITNDEIQELITDYSNLYKKNENEMSAPVSCC